jgi:methylthioribose-1-phosphate isomerase
MPTHPLGAVAWRGDGVIRILDQTRLPEAECYLDLRTVDEVAEAIRMLRVRGAPLIGIVAAMAAALATSPEELRLACERLRATRPTAVNLGWALDRMLRCGEEAARRGEPLGPALVAEARAIWEEDQAMCRRIGEVGLEVVSDGATVLTHCNAGALATGGIGTALAPLYLARERGRRVAVIASETRPLLQGSRLTAWELQRAGIPVTLIGDAMAASRLRQGGVGIVLVGVDRVARNGDVANKIGTYSLALAARAHGVPFYVAAPTSSFDPGTPEGSAIPIEERRPEELRTLGPARTAPEGVPVWNPAFDVTPAELITGYITDRGLLTAGELALRLGR